MNFSSKVRTLMLVSACCAIVLWSALQWMRHRERQKEIRALQANVLELATELHAEKLRYYQQGEITFTELTESMLRLFEAEMPVYGKQKALARHLQRIDNHIGLTRTGNWEVSRSGLTELRYLRAKAQLEMLKN